VKVERGIIGIRNKEAGKRVRIAEMRRDGICKNNIKKYIIQSYTTLYYIRLY